MSTFFFALLAGVAWMGLLGEIGWGPMLTGVVLGLLIRRVERAESRRPFTPRAALALSWMGLRFAAVFFWELVVAVIVQVRIVLAPRIDIQPGWIRFATELETPALRVLLGVVLSLTPGSIVYEESTSPDGTCSIAIHVIDLRDEERVIDRVRRRFEAPLRAMETL